MNLSVASYYDADQHVAEIYDTQETGMQDVALIRPHIGPAGALRVLDPVCGTGRILVSLAGDGHTLLGLDRSPAMLDRAWRALVHWPAEVSSRVSLYAADVLSNPWQSGYDLVILGGNWLYELATEKDQAGVISRAGASLLPGGHLYLDNDHMDGPLGPACRATERSRSFRRAPARTAHALRVRTAWCGTIRPYGWPALSAP
jgi:SAM-dependent methyltransferase